VAKNLLRVLNGVALALGAVEAEHLLSHALILGQPLAALLEKTLDQFPIVRVNTKDGQFLLVNSELPASAEAAKFQQHLLAARGG
jgi:hypothetical protein